MTELGGPSADYLARAKKRMSDIDALAPDIREIVHEEGWSVVHAFLNLGIRQARHIRHLIAAVRRGSAEYGNVGKPRAKRAPTTAA
jgi:hypothetical protein